MSLLQPEAIINLQRLEHNAAVLQKIVSDSKIMAVVKADAYGHGVVETAQKLYSSGVHGFCVALVKEAAELVEAGIKSPILHLGAITEDALSVYNGGQVRCTISSEDDLQILENSGIDGIFAHIKVDTGMGRLGVPMEKAEDLFALAGKSKRIKIEGLYSHFSTAEEVDTSYRDHQLSRFNYIIAKSRPFLPDVSFYHIANSAGILLSKKTHFNMVRPGISVYGVSPLGKPHEELKPVMEYRVPVAMVKNYNAGELIGYNRLYTTQENENIAVLQAGYADGIPLDFSTGGQVEIKGKLHPISGKVSMDLTTISCLKETIKQGDYATFWGNEIPDLKLENLAKKFNTIPYELLTGVTARVKRVYI